MPNNPPLLLPPNDWEPRAPDWWLEDQRRIAAQKEVDACRHKPDIFGCWQIGVDRLIQTLINIGRFFIR